MNPVLEDLVPPRALVEHAAESYRGAGEFARRFARGKLAGDPVFTVLLAGGLVPDGGRILDLGCGQGLLAAWLRAASAYHAKGHWPAGWPPPPQRREYTGIELMAADLRRAQTALGAEARFEQEDIRHAVFGEADLVVILDVLHFLPASDQEALLRRVRGALAPGGVLLTRIGDASAGFPFRLGKWVDHSIAFFRQGRYVPLYCRTLAEWRQLLEDCGFCVSAMPMSSGRPFANVLLVAGT